MNDDVETFAPRCLSATWKMRKEEVNLGFLQVFAFERLCLAVFRTHADVEYVSQEAWKKQKEERP